MTIDTLAYVKHLEEAGVERRHAEAQAEAMNRHVIPDLPTRDDLRMLGTELRGEMARLGADLRKEMVDLKVWLIGSQIAVVGLALGFAKLIF